MEQVRENTSDSYGYRFKENIDPIGKKSMEIFYKTPIDTSSLYNDTLSLALSRNILSGLQKFYLNDIEFVVGQEKKVIRANSFLLACRSEVFEKMFFLSNMKEQTTKKCIIIDSTPVIFEKFLQYLYGSTLKFCNLKTILHLHYLAEKYIVESLKVDCKSIIERTVTTKNVISILNAIVENEEEYIFPEYLKSVCWTLLINETEYTLSYVMDDETIRSNLSEKLMILFLQQEVLHIEEYKLFVFLLRWRKAHGVDDSKMKTLSGYIRFPLFEPRQLIDDVKNSGLLPFKQYVEALEFSIRSNKEDSSGITRNKRFRKREVQKTPQSFTAGLYYRIENNRVKVTNHCSNIAFPITDSVTHGKHVWHVEILSNKAKWILVGIRMSSATRKHGWFMKVNNGSLFIGPPFDYLKAKFVQSPHHSSTTNKCAKVISVYLDMTLQTIAYAVDYCHHATVFDKIDTSQALCLAVLLPKCGDAVQLVQKE